MSNFLYRIADKYIKKWVKNNPGDNKYNYVLKKFDFSLAWLLAGIIYAFIFQVFGTNFVLFIPFVFLIIIYVLIQITYRNTLNEKVKIQNIILKELEKNEDTKKFFSDKMKKEYSDNEGEELIKMVINFFSYLVLMALSIVAGITCGTFSILLFVPYFITNFISDIFITYSPYIEDFQ